MATIESPGPDVCCSFCGKHRREIAKLISAKNVFICDECVGVCVEVFFAEMRGKPPQPPAPPTTTASPWESRFPRTELPPGTHVGGDVATRDGYLVPETTLRAASMGFVPRLPPQPPAPPQPAGDADVEVAYVAACNAWGNWGRACSANNWKNAAELEDIAAASVLAYGDAREAAARRADREEIERLKVTLDSAREHVRDMLASYGALVKEHDASPDGKIYFGLDHRMDAFKALARLKALLLAAPEGTP